MERQFALICRVRQRRSCAITTSLRGFCLCSANDQRIRREAALVLGRPARPGTAHGSIVLVDGSNLHAHATFPLNDDIAYLEFMVSRHSPEPRSAAHWNTVRLWRHLCNATHQLSPGPETSGGARGGQEGGRPG